MIDFTNYIYSPVLRTRRAELKGLSELQNPYEAGLLPLIELTRSRRTKSNPEGSVDVSLDDLLRIIGNAHFVVDVTTLKSLTNSEVEQLLNPSQGFRKWQEFATKRLPKSAIPIVHLTDPFDAKSVELQVNHFLESWPAVAFRIPSEFDALSQLADAINLMNVDSRRLVIYADVSMVTERGYRGALARVREVISTFAGLAPGLLSPLASSFPSTVTPFGNVRGVIPLHEVSLSDGIKEEFDELNCIHGDYGCVHPIDMEGMAINWVPRIDVPLEGSLFYYRFRRHDGGYVRAAEAALTDREYVPLNCWADQNIKSAASGNPPGKAPAFWISTRVNFHIERQMIRLGA